MKIKRVAKNNRKKAFEVTTSRFSLLFPYSKALPRHDVKDRIVGVWIDKELGREAFTFVLESGQEGTAHIDEVLDYNRDPSYLRDMLLYRLTVEARRRVEESQLSKREIIRRLGTSATQFYRLLDQTNYRKSIDKLLALLHVLDCDVELVVRERTA